MKISQKRKKMEPETRVVNKTRSAKPTVRDLLAVETRMTSCLRKDQRDSFPCNLTRRCDLTAGAAP